MMKRIPLFQTVQVIDENTSVIFVFNYNKKKKTISIREVVLQEISEFQNFAESTRKLTNYFVNFKKRSK